MQINRNNYEEYFIDYFEGNLSRDDQEKLRDFLSENPDLKSQFEKFGKLDKVESRDEYKFKAGLKKQIGDLGEVTADTIDEYSIAYLENDLNEKERILLLSTIEKNADFKKIFTLYQKTKLQADQSVKFTRKSRLKHFTIEKKSVLRLTGYVSAAAVVILGIFLMIPIKNSKPDRVQIAEKTKVETSLDTITKKEIKVIKKKNPVFTSVTHIRTTEIKPLISESLNAENQRHVQLKKLETKTIDLIKTDWQQNIVLINNQENSNKQFEDSGKQPVENQSEILAEKATGKKLDFWGVAELGLKIFGKMNEVNLNVKPNYTNSGKLNSVTLITEKRKITAPASL